MKWFNDGKPWFRRWMFISVRPITFKGSLVEFAALAGFLVLAGVGVQAESAWHTALFMSLAAGVGLAFWLIVQMKLEGDF